MKKVLFSPFPFTLFPTSPVFPAIHIAVGTPHSGGVSVARPFKAGVMIGAFIVVASATS